MTADEIVRNSQDAIWETQGEPILINGLGPYQAIREEVSNEFDAMAGTIYRLAFKGHEAISVEHGSTLVFVNSNKTVKATSPIKKEHRKQVVDYEPH